MSADRRTSSRKRTRTVDIKPSEEEGLKDLLKSKDVFQNAKDKLGMDKNDGVEEVSEKIKSFMCDENLSLSDAMARGFTKDDLSEYSAKNGKSGNGSEAVIALRIIGIWQKKFESSPAKKPKPETSSPAAAAKAPAKSSAKSPANKAPPKGKKADTAAAEEEEDKEEDKEVEEQNGKEEEAEGKKKKAPPKAKDPPAKKEKEAGKGRSPRGAKAKEEEKAENEEEEESGQKEEVAEEEADKKKKTPPKKKEPPPKKEAGKSRSPRGAKTTEEEKVEEEKVEEEKVEEEKVEEEKAEVEKAEEDDDKDFEDEGYVIVKAGKEAEAEAESESGEGPQGGHEHALAPHEDPPSSKKSRVPQPYKVDAVNRPCIVDGLTRGGAP